MILIFDKFRWLFSFNLGDSRIVLILVRNCTRTEWLCFQSGLIESNNCTRKLDLDPSVVFKELNELLRGKATILPSAAQTFFGRKEIGRGVPEIRIFILF